jgi:hypothetical protein
MIPALQKARCLTACQPMKFLAALSTLLLSVAASAHADILIYGGIAPARELGYVSTIRREREIFVIDTDNQQIQRIHAGILGRRGVFSVGDLETIHIVMPITARRSYTIISQADTTIGSGTNFTTKSLYLRGLNSRVRIAVGTQILAPRVLGGQDRTVTKNDAQLSSLEQSFAAALNVALTVASNTAHETLSEAVDRVTIALENANYRKL